MKLSSAKWDYARWMFTHRRHHERLKRFIEGMEKKLVCQECGGAGGEVEPVLDYGAGPWIDCGFCEGIGYVTPHIRGLWLRFQREKDNAKAER